MNRPSWDEYFIHLAYVAATRSTCLRRRVGAVAVRDKLLLGTGYNGAPSGAAHCLDVGCLREQLKVPSGERHELCRACHAEQNLIAQAAKFGVELRGATIYCTTSPCSMCAKAMIQAGIVEVVFVEGYPDVLSLEFLRECGVFVRRVNEHGECLKVVGEGE